MRKLIYTIHVTIDGCCDHTKMVPDEELFDYSIQLIRDVDLFVYGRKTYQLMVPYWPDIAKNPSETTPSGCRCGRGGCRDLRLIKADIEFAQAWAGGFSETNNGTSNAPICDKLWLDSSGPSI
jgi:hypothetical protein